MAAAMTATPHSAGIFADMTLDGPEIGTLVIIVDRAKNLPNRKSMGKQSAYCAMRLGKEARKTETDKRGGQTPKWDQELRFTVHDSPDYNTMKISVFSEDKKTDLIGEAWVKLDDVIVAGGGKNDLWQGLNCKGKYAGEIRIELTYYDSRPKPERPRGLSMAASIAGSEEVMSESGLRQSVGGSGSGSRVKRRPLPTNPNSSGNITTSDAVPGLGVAAPGRAKYGPRDFSTPPRANSMPPEMPGHQPTPPQSGYVSNPQSYAGSPMQPAPQNGYYEEQPQQYAEQDDYENAYQHPVPDFLPQLPPSNRQRPGHQRFGSMQAQTAPGPSPVQQPRPASHIGLMHSHSAPAVPQEQHGYQLNTDYPDPIPDVDYQHRQLRQRRSDAPPGWQDDYADYPDPYAQEAEEPAPPPPPMHTHSAPIVPHFSQSQQPSPSSTYGNTPPGGRHHTIPSASPLQSVERRYGAPPPQQQQQTPTRGHPARGRSVDAYGQSPEHSPYGTSPSNYAPGQTPSPYARPSPTRAPLVTRHSVADPYATTPTRPHPLSQEVPRPRSRSPMPGYPGPRAASPLPYEHQQQSYQHDPYSNGGPPLIKPRALSPRPTPPNPTDRPRSSRSTYSIQHPVRAHESSDGSPLSASLPRQGTQYTPTAQKNVSPRPSPTVDTAAGRSPGSSMPFSPDSFDVHRPGGGAAAEEAERSGPIVGWHGQEIDPSDHLPVNSWAPEPEKKTPTKTYGLGRDREFGPRSAGGTPSNSAGRLGKDTVVSFKMKPASAEPSPTVSSGRNRLMKKSGSGSGGRSPVPEPLREHANYNSVPDPYAGQASYSPNFQHGQLGYSPDPYGGGPPSLPPKVPLQQHNSSPNMYGGGGGYGGPDALAREIGSIDIGSGRRSRNGGGSPGGVPPPTAYVPVRSQRLSERGSYY